MKGAAASLGLWTLCMSGCVGGPPERTLSLARETAAQMEWVNARVDALEDRLLGNQANVHLWQELARRHEQISAVACRSQDAHYVEMVELLQKQEDKGRRLRKRRVAEWEGPALAQGRPSGK